MLQHMHVQVGFTALPLIPFELDIRTGYCGESHEHGQNRVQVRGNARNAVEHDRIRTNKFGEPSTRTTNTNMSEHEPVFSPGISASGPGSPSGLSVEQKTAKSSCFSFFLPLRPQRL